MPLKLRGGRRSYSKLSFWLRTQRNSVWCLYIFIQKKYLRCWIIYGLFLIKNMQTPPLRSGYIYMTNAHCVETNEKSILRYLFFELWLIIFQVFRWNTLISKCATDQNRKKKSLQKWPISNEICAMCWNEWKIHFWQFIAYGIWSISYWNLDIFFMLAP